MAAPCAEKAVAIKSAFNIPSLCIMYKACLLATPQTERTGKHKVWLIDDRFPCKAPGANSWASGTYAHKTLRTEDHELPEVVADGAPLHGVSTGSPTIELRDTPPNS